MSRFRLLAPLLALSLLGTAAAQGVHNVYFVFRLATTLPVTLGATPQCVAEREEWLDRTATSADGPGLTVLETYSFVSAREVGGLRQDIETYAREHAFPGEDLPPQEGPGGEAGRDFRDPAAPGFRYLVRVYGRPEVTAAPSVLCVTVLAPSLSTVH